MSTTDYAIEGHGEIEAPCGALYTGGVLHTLISQRMARSPEQCSADDVALACILMRGRTAVNIPVSKPVEAIAQWTAECAREACRLYGLEVGYFADWSSIEGSEALETPAEGRMTPHEIQELWRWAVVRRERFRCPDGEDSQCSLVSDGYRHSCEEVLSQGTLGDFEEARQVKPVDKPLSREAIATVCAFADLQFLSLVAGILQLGVLQAVIGMVFTDLSENEGARLSVLLMRDGKVMDSGEAGRRASSVA